MAERTRHAGPLFLVLVLAAGGAARGTDVGFWRQYKGADPHTYVLLSFDEEGPPPGEVGCSPPG